MAAFVLVDTAKYHEKLDAILSDESNRYSLQSSAELLEAIKDTHGTGIIASLDVESLFTNVPVDETTDIILDRVYRNQSTAPLNILEASLHTLLEVCMKKAPFSPNYGQMFRQKDGVVMGSPLGVLFANFYMGTMEERVFARMAFVRRALSHCSIWQDTHQEFDRTSQVLVNNGYSNKSITKEVRKALEKWYGSESPQPRPRIISSCRRPLKQTHVVYQHTCLVCECSGAYVGMTTMRLSKRLSCHAQEGAIKNHACTKRQEAISYRTRRSSGRPLMPVGCACWRRF
ncbi:uncharacterized protein LOC135221159 [Macrobrachium nipponense]|uniref:uncharacterized protein LOC135221159 n=1 Tax=Macrobrachium nipponense TaxID=159736 RepID=UPI0030C8C813